MSLLIRIALLAALCTTMLTGTADAATPSKNTTYSDGSVDAELVGTMKIKVGSSTTKINKLTLVATCEDGTKEKLVEKDVRLTDGSFDIALGPGQSIEGSFKTKHKVTGKFRTDLCDFFGGSFTAKD